MMEWNSPAMLFPLKGGCLAMSSYTTEHDGDANHALQPRDHMSTLFV